MKVLHRLLLLSLALTAVLATACAGRTFKVEPAQVQKIQSIAIIGFDTYVSTDIGSKLAKLIGPDLLMQTLASGWSAGNLSPVDSKMPYDALARRLQSELGVRVLTHEALTQNQAYADLYRTLSNEHSVGNLRIDGVLSGDAARNLSEVQRAALRAALGVDAIMAVEMSYWLDDTDTISDIGGEKLWARIDAALFADGEAPIWRDQADGERSKKGIPPLVRQEVVADLRVALGQATDNALALLFAHLNQRCPECRNQQPAVAPATMESAPATEPATAAVPMAVPQVPHSPNGTAAPVPPATTAAMPATSPHSLPATAEVAEEPATAEPASSSSQPQ